MTAMILAAGLGSRMKPLTNHTPKPLLKVGTKSLIVWHIEQLKKAGFLEIVINVAYLGQQIIDYLGDGSDFGVRIVFSDEQEEGPLETAGGIIKALAYLSDTFLVVNGDVWTDYNYDKNFKLLENNLAHLILVENPEHNVEGDFFLTGTKEKYTFSGIGYYSKRLFSNLKYGKQALAPLLFEAMASQKVSTTYYNGYWHDIGTVKRLEYLDKILKNNKESYHV
ncbi:MAG: Glucose-1-phosphate thymidylyltransferase (EC [uncultured Sulfurovum sp.]|uniref:Glucose-1-phosphate thymidylyltransferase (EC) n=1 Tax=uncultured Sulfurovum sp. TaxID=269237 RepID=A0A6S6UCR8_9BACT|nr:MAG: Glucose-1-phosphate thymidylyltransferase (EC [uncultured Sulfurovum sp.]